MLKKIIMIMVLPFIAVISVTPLASHAFELVSTCKKNSSDAIGNLTFVSDNTLASVTRAKFFYDTSSIWDATTGKLKNTYSHHDFARGCSFYTDMRYTKRGLKFIFGSAHTKGILFADQARTLEFIEDKYSIDLAVISPDGETIAYSNSDTVYLWNKGQKRVLRSGLSDISCMAFNSSGSQLCTLSNKGMLTFWSVASQERQCSIQLPANGYKWSTNVAFSNTHVAVEIRGSLFLWDISENALHPVETDEEYISALAFSPNGERLITGRGSHCTVWDARRVVKLDELTLSETITAVCFSRNSKMAGIGCSKGDIHVYSVSD